jgi:hypothetical protein
MVMRGTKAWFDVDRHLDPGRTDESERIEVATTAVVPAEKLLDRCAARAGVLEPPEHAF